MKEKLISETSCDFACERYASAMRSLSASAIREVLIRILTNATGSLLPRDIALHMQVHSTVRQQEFVVPEQFRFKDDGVFPNSDLPLLVYRHAFTTEAEDCPSIIEQCLAENDWTNSWQNGVYSFAHYHSTTHEALAVYCGAATLRVGGQHSKDVDLHAGDVIVIPAGVAHRNIGASADFAVVGAYPGGREWDLLRGLPGERFRADHNIAALPIPDNDPIYGADGPLRQIWKSNRAAAK